MNLKDEIQKYVKVGYSPANATSKVCQDIILLKISKNNMSYHVTIKGGVVMMQLSKDKRRATQDLDMDFIKYSLKDEAIYSFINKLSDNDIKLTIKSITELKHQSYSGKRIFLKLEDKYNNKLNAKIDLGIHNDLDIEQENMYFDLNIIDDTVSLLANSKEQIFVEKLKSLLKFRVASTRYKDIFDFYFLINQTDFDKNKCLQYINKLIFEDKSFTINNIDQIYEVLNNTLNNHEFQNMLNQAKNNWLELPVNKVTNSLLDFINSLSLINV